MEPKVSLLCTQDPDAMNIQNVKSIQYSTKAKHFIQRKSLSFFFLRHFQGIRIVKDGNWYFFQLICNVV